MAYKEPQKARTPASSGLTSRQLVPVQMVESVMSMCVLLPGIL